MDIRINQMILQNFKGIRSLEINASGESLSIYGDNATGKTTVFDAFTWLLFGKDSLGRSDFGIKTQDEYGNPIHNLEHSVECELAIDNSILTLKKVYVEKWTKKRGSAEAEFSGHETKYYINEVPSSKGEYTAKISGIIDETLFKIITNPLYFNENMKWQDRRAILLNLCDNITDEDILAQNEQFAPLSAELKGRTIHEYKKIIQNKQAGINDELKSIPQRIDEANRAISATVEVDESEKATIERKIADLEGEITAIKNGAFSGNTEVIALQERKRELELKKCDVTDIQNEHDKYVRELSNVNFEVSNCERNIRTAFDNIRDLETKANVLREKWHEVNNKQYDGKDICPTCGQALPTELTEKSKEVFNLAKVAELEEITAKGKAIKADIKLFTSNHDTMAKQLEGLRQKENGLENSIAKCNEKITEATHKFADEIKVEVEAINTRIAELEKSAQNAKENIESKIYPIQEQIATEKAKLKEIDRAIMERDLAERQKQRIAELEALEKTLAGEYANLEKIAFLIEEFIKFKVELLSEEINSHFKYAKFKLFDVQINGGIAECCEVTYKGVPYSDLNNASRINIGLDIINTLCKLNDRFAPIIVDNSESVTNIMPTTSQMICLVVSAEDKTLRIEKGV